MVSVADARMAALRRSQKLQLAATNFTEFVEAVARDEKGNALRLAPHHLAWHRHVEYCWARGIHAGIMAPFGHGKSTGLIAPLIAFMLGRNPNSRIKVITNDDSSASNRVALAGRILRSPTYRRVFPSVYPGGQWTSHKLFVNRPGWSQEASVEAKGVLSTGVGGRSDVNLFDDTVDQKNSREAAVRKHTRELIEETWMSRLEPTGFTLAIGTMWHLDDAWNHLMLRPGWLWLVQRIHDPTLSYITQELIGECGPDYPGAVLGAEAATANPGPVP